MKKNIILISLAFYCSLLYGQKKYFIHYENLKIQESCEGESVRSKVPASVFSIDTPIRITNLGSDLSQFKLFYLGKQIKKDSSFFLTAEEDLSNIFVEFTVEELLKSPNIYFNQRNEDFERNDTISIHTGYYNISTKTEEVIISKSCLERVYLVLPVIATQTDLKFFKFENGEYTEPILRTYYAGMGGNIIGIPRIATGKYKIGLTGCYSPYSEFEIELK